MAVAIAAVVAAGLMAAIAPPAEAATANPSKAAGNRRNATRLSFPVSGTTGLTVDVGTGNGMITDQLFTLPGVVNDVPITLSYNSTVSGTDIRSVVTNKDGAGWVITGFDQRVKTNSDNSVTYYGPGGLTGVFDKTGSGDSDYKAPRQFRADLKRVPPGYTLTSHVGKQKLSFDTDGRLSTAEDRNGNKTSYNYSAVGVATSIQTSRGSDATRTVAVTTNSSNRITKLTQTIGSVTRSVSLAYTTNGFLKSVTDTAGGVTSFASASGTDTGKIATITNPAGATTTLGYLSSTSGKVVTVAQANPASSGGAGTALTRLEYTDGTKTRVADPGTSTSQTILQAPHTTYDLDSDELVTKASDQLEHSRSKTYTGLGDVASSTPAAGGATSFTYGANNSESLTKIASPGGASQTASYGNSGSNAYLPSSTTNDSSNSLKYTYNASGNQQSTQQGETGPSGKVNYNDNGTVDNSASPGAADTDQTHYAYDDNKNLIRVNFPGLSLGVRKYTYDAYGRLATATTGNGTEANPVTISYTYDSLDRITKVLYSDGTPSVFYTYNSIGKITQRVDASGTTKYTYDALGNLTSVVNGIGGGTIKYTYDLSNAVKTETTDIGTVTYGYDNAHQLISMTYPQGGGIQTARFKNDDDNRRTDAWMQTAGTLTDGVPSVWAAHTHTDYDDSGRITHVIGEQGPATSPTKTIDQKLCYSANSDAPDCSDADADDRSKIQWSRDTVTGATQSYTYNGDDRLSKVKVDGSSNPGTWNFKYDDAGNRTSATFSGTGVTDQTPTFEKNNQISNSSYTYDTAGNRTVSPRRTSTFNAAGQQTKTVTGQGGYNTSQYTYAGTDQNELVQQTNAYPRTYKYYYGRTDSNGLPIIEKIGVSNEPRDAAVFHDNTGAPVMLQSTNDVTCLYVFDGTGNPVAISTSYQTTAVALRYDPYGAENRLDSGGDNGGWVDSPYSFGTGIKDRATGEIKYGQRWYDPQTGTWTQQDALNAPLDPKNANRYAYAAGDPINSADPTGNNDVSDFFTNVAGAAFGGLTGFEIGAEAGFFIGEAIDPLGGGVPGALIGGAVGAVFGAAYGAAGGGGLTNYSPGLQR